MGEEVDAVLLKKVKQTQEALGAFVRKPPLTEKHLMKPPFRFIHDIVMSITESTGFLQGLYEGSELDATTITTRETKTAWMTKLVECLKLATGDDVGVKVSKILAGQEPSKTNDLLICLANAVARNINSDKAVQTITGRDLSGAASTSKPKAGGDPPKKKKESGASGAKLKDVSPYSQSIQKKPTKGQSKSKPTDGDKTRRVSKPNEVPPAKGRQSKAGMSSSPPKAASKPVVPRQSSTDRLGGSRSNRREAQDKLSPVRSSTSMQDRARESRRLSTQLSTEDGPTSLNEAADIILDESRGGGGSRRGSLSSSSAVPPKESRTASSYRQSGSRRDSMSGPISGGVEDLDETFASAEAHADDVEQAEFMGELEFLLKKHGYDGGHAESEGEGVDTGDVGGEGDVGILSQKTDKVDNDDFPGSSSKESIPAKRAGEQGGSSEAVKIEQESLDDNDVSEKIISPTLSVPRQPSAGPSTSRMKSASPTTDPQLPTPSPSTSALSVTTAVLGTLSPSPGPPSGKSSSLGVPDVNEKAPSRPPTARPHTSQMRPGGSNMAVSVPRPPSARPAPPRPKTALFQDKEESTFRPTTAKVQNVLLDEDEPDDENYIVHEVTAAEKPPGELQLSDTADLGISGSILEENIDLILDPEQRGLLVNQMLDAQSRLEDGSRLAPGGTKKTEIEREGGLGEKDRMRWREDAAAEVEKLKNLMQLMARNANPLGKLMDFVQEDVDAMQRDLGKWREESRKLDQALEAAQEETDLSVEPLRRKMTELDEAIQDRLDAIAATKMSTFRQEERIRKVLMGLDKVKVRSGNEPIITAADLTNLIEPDEGFDFGGNKVYFKKSNTSSPSPV